VIIMGALTQFDCTACGKTLKSPKPIAEGTKIKCPKCMQVFVVSNGAGGGTTRRSGGDLSTGTTRRPTRADKRKRSSPLVMWGTCFVVGLLFSLIIWVPASIAIRVGQSAASDAVKERERQLKEFEKLNKDMSKDFGKDMMKDMGKDMPKDFGKDMPKDFGKDFDKFPK
jgi:hypothetical protein